jgi:D-alanine transaminase
MPDVYYINGKFVDREDAVISVEDRGFQFGDGIYEVIRTYNGKFLRLDDHIRRMYKGLKAIEISIPFEQDEFENLCIEALIRSGYKEALIYIQITRGISKRSHVPPLGLEPTIIVIIYKTPDYSPKLWEDGIKVVLLPDIRWLRCCIKTIQLLPNTLAKTKAALEGGQEVILHRGDIITEAGSSNVFMVKDGIIKTHPANDFILHGINRRLVIEFCKGNSIDIREEEYTIPELLNADEVFITGTGNEVMPVTQVGDKTIGNGKPGPITNNLVKIFRDYVANL